jgi:hypothetical protein
VTCVDLRDNLGSVGRVLLARAIESHFAVAYRRTILGLGKKSRCCLGSIDFGASCVEVSPHTLTCDHHIREQNGLENDPCKLLALAFRMENLNIGFEIFP